MKTKSTLLLLVFVLVASTQFSSAQNTKFSANNLPENFQELQRGLPSPQLMQTNPALYKHLMQRYAILSGMLQKAVADKQLPKEALSILSMQPPLSIKDKAAVSSATQQAVEGNYNLVKDVNSMANSNPYNYNFTVATTFAVLNNILYYSADDGVHGNELWRSDGTTIGTYMVKDINRGTQPGSVGYITVFKSKLYFMAYEPTTGYELYKSDGTEAGTFLLKDIIPGTGGSQPQHLTICNNLLYFTTTNASYNYNSQIWRTDGTANGTIMVADLYNLSSAYNIGQLTAVNSNLFFTAYNYSYGREIWKTDGASTILIKDINPYNNNNYVDNDGPTNLTSFNNLLYFSANNGSVRTLWQSDGTYAGTNIVNYQNGVSLPTNVNDYAQYQDQPFAIAKNSLFFAGSYYTTGTELYKYNPYNSAGIVLVKDISSADASSSITTEQIVSLKDSIYFITPDFTGKILSLWKSGGADANTKLLKTLTNVTSYNGMCARGSKIYFGAQTNASGLEPWMSDGTAAGTKMIKDIIPGPTPSAPYTFTQCNGKIYFSAFTLNQGNELWVTNGSTPGTNIVADVNTTSTQSGVPDNLYNTVKKLTSDKIVFNGNQFNTGVELWKSNGTASGTNIVSDIYPGYNSGYPQLYDVKNSKVYFMATDSLGNEGVYYSDGTAANTKRIATSSGYIYNIKVADNGTVFYTNYTNSLDLWRTDSSNNNFRVSTNIYGSNTLATAGNVCVFTGYNIYGYELWKSDGTAQGTNIIADLYPGSNSSSPYYFQNFGSKVIFSANTISGTFPFITDGTVAGTKQLSTTISPQFSLGGVELNSKFYFNGYEPAYGNELYVTDGSTTGTKLVKDIYVGSTSGYPQNFAVAGATLYFSATDEVNGNELWKSTGSATSTKLVKDITPGSGSTYPYYLTGASGKLFFVIDNQLWSSDGTSAQTIAVNDAGLANIQYINYLISAGSKLFISAYDYAYGNEFYEGDASASKFVANSIAKTLSAPNLYAQIAINPFINDLKIVINSPVQQKLKVSINNAGGLELSTKIINVNNGSNSIIVDSKTWIHGVYFVKITSSDTSINLKAIK